MRQIQGKEASPQRQVCVRPAEVPGLRDLHVMAGVLLPVLRLQAQDQAAREQVEEEDVVPEIPPVTGVDPARRRLIGDAHFSDRRQDRP